MGVKLIGPCSNEAQMGQVVFVGPGPGLAHDEESLSWDWEAKVLRIGAATVSTESGFSGPGSGLTGLNPAQISAGTAPISITGNAATVTHGLYSTGRYEDPAWLTGLAGSKVRGDIAGRASGLTGTLAVAQGGTGAASLPTGHLLAGNGDAAVAPVAVGPGLRLAGGALGVDAEVVVSRDASETIRGTKTFRAGAPSRRSLVVQAEAGQATPLTEWSDAQGAPVATVAPDGSASFAGISGGLDSLSPNGRAFARNFWFPREADLLSNVMLDYQDEFAFADRQGRSISILPAPDAVTASEGLNTLFRDDSQVVVWNQGTSPYPIRIEVNCAANPIPHRNSGHFNLGLTFRSSGTPLPRQITLEAWDDSAGAYVQVHRGEPTYHVPGQGFTCWLSPRFTAPAGASFRITRLRITLEGSNPIPLQNFLRIQRVILYHGTHTWDPWHLHVGGGDVYGPVTIQPSSEARSLVVRAAPSGIQNLQEWHSGAGAVLGAIRRDGSWKPPFLADAAAVSDSLYYSTTANKLVYKDPSGVVRHLY